MPSFFAPYRYSALSKTPGILEKSKNFWKHGYIPIAYPVSALLRLN